MELTERTHSHLGIGKRKETEQTKGREGYEKTEFGQDAAISVEEEAIFVQSYKSCARDLDIERTLDPDPPGDHRMQAWSQSGYLPTRRSDFRASTKVPIPRIMSPLNLTLTLSTTWMRAYLETIACKFGVTIKPFVSYYKRFAQKSTDRQTTDAARLY